MNSMTTSTDCWSLPTESFFTTDAQIPLDSCFKFLLFQILTTDSWPLKAFLTTIDHKSFSLRWTRTLLKQCFKTHKRVDYVFLETMFQDCFPFFIDLTNLKYSMWFKKTASFVSSPASCFLFQVLHLVSNFSCFRFWLLITDRWKLS